MLYVILNLLKKSSLGFESINDRHGCVDVDECNQAESDDNLANFYSVFYAYPDLYDLSLNGLIFNSSDSDLQKLLFGAQINLKSTQDKNSLAIQLNDCRVFCEGTFDMGRCLADCVIFSYDTLALTDSMAVQVPKCTYSCSNTPMERWTSCYSLCLEQNLNLPPTMLKDIYDFVDLCLDNNGADKTEMCSTTAGLTSVISREESMHQELVENINF